LTPAEIVRAIDAERIRADDKHGEMSVSADAPSNFHRVAVLTEELGEVSRAALDGAPDQLRAELVQLAACCHAWLGRLP
jgi:NTP pyrophosphatase (non-canonical NTP hydrolase)